VQKRQRLSGGGRTDETELVEVDARLSNLSVL
jgi:hypothetical protein